MKKLFIGLTFLIQATLLQAYAESFIKQTVTINGRPVEFNFVGDVHEKCAADKQHLAIMDDVKTTWKKDKKKTAILLEGREWELEKNYNNPEIKQAYENGEIQPTVALNCACIDAYCFPDADIAEINCDYRGPNFYALWDMCNAIHEPTNEFSAKLQSLVATYKADGEKNQLTIDNKLFHALGFEQYESITLADVLDEIDMVIGQVQIAALTYPVLSNQLFELAQTMIEQRAALATFFKQYSTSAQDSLVAMFVRFCNEKQSITDAVTDFYCDIVDAPWCIVADAGFLITLISYAHSYDRIMIYAGNAHTLAVKDLVEQMGALEPQTITALGMVDKTQFGMLGPLVDAQLQSSLLTC